MYFFKNLNRGVYMKKIILPTLLFGALFLTACNNKPEDEIIVKMEAGTITKEEFYQELKKISGEKALKGLVYKKIIDGEVDVTDKEVEEKMKEIQNQFTSQEAFNEYLRQNNLKSMDDFKREVRYSLLYFKFSTKDIEVPEEEIKEIYEKRKEEVKVAHILVPDEATAEEILNRIQNGEDFAALAKEYSLDESSKENGGELGYIYRGIMSKEFEDAAFSLNEGEYSAPIKTDRGYHIIKMINKKTLSYEALKPKIEEEIKASKAPDPNIVFTELEENQNIQVLDKDLEHIFEAIE